jgi:hypothetical protein
MSSHLRMRVQSAQLLYQDADNTLHSLYVEHATIQAGKKFSLRALGLDSSVTGKPTRLSWDVIRNAIERSQRRETKLQWLERYWKKESSETEKSAVLSLAATGIIKVFQHGSANLAFPLLPISVAGLIGPAFPFGAYAFTAAVPTLVKNGSKIAECGKGFLSDCANITLASAPLFASLTFAGITDQVIDSRLKDCSQEVREVTKCVVGVGLGALGEVASAALLGAALPSLTTAAWIGGSAYLTVRAVKWLVGEVVNSIGG